MKRATALTALALASALALTACEGTDTDGAETTPASVTTASAPATLNEESSPTAGTPTTTGTAEATATTTGEPVDAEHNNADVMFTRMMIPHHQQAIDMSELLLAKDDIPTEVRGFAQQIIQAQAAEIERMNAMLDAWDQEPMGMGNRGGIGRGDRDGREGRCPSPGSGSGGMMCQEDIAALEDAQGIQAVRLYLERMTTHHQGAIEMAQNEVDNGQNPQTVQLARDIITAQKAEITEMQQMLQGL